MRFCVGFIAIQASLGSVFVNQTASWVSIISSLCHATRVLPGFQIRSFFNIMNSKLWKVLLIINRASSKYQAPGRRLWHEWTLLISILRALQYHHLYHIGQRNSQRARTPHTFAKYLHHSPNLSKLYAIRYCDVGCEQPKVQPFQCEDTGSTSKRQVVSQIQIPHFVQFPAIYHCGIVVDFVFPTHNPYTEAFTEPRG